MRDRGTILWLDPRDLVEDPENVRHDAPDVQLLADSIRAHGVLQPLGVSRHADRYHVVYGMRRRRAAIAAGLETVPCVELSGDRLVCQLLENLHRVDLNDMEKADGFARLKEQLALREREASDARLDELTASTLGISPTTVRRYLRLRTLPTSVRALLRSGELGVTQAQHLCALGQPAQQEALGRAAAERGLSAAAISRAAGWLAASPNLAVDEALAAAERGESAPSNLGKTNAPKEPTRLAPRPSAQDTTDENRELWGDEAVTDDDLERAARERRQAAPAEAAFGDVATADGHRVFRIRTIDAFCDEVARLARCASEGDLARAAAGDPKAAVKLDLAARQLRYLLTAMDDLSRAKSA